MTPEQFLSLDEIKARCGISGTDLDSQLQTFRSSAIGIVESRTRRHIVDADIPLLSPSAGIGRGFIEFFAYDIAAPDAAIDIRYRTAQEDPGFERDGTLSIPAAKWSVLKDRIRAYNASGESGAVLDWPDRDTSVHYEATFSVGIPSGKAPAEFTAAALMIVREMQEGSLLDQLPPNILDIALQDHVKPALTATDELLLSAGVG